MKYNLIFSVIVAFIFWGCQNYEPEVRDYPILKTLDVININSSGATFRGELVKEGIDSITSYGFIWSLNTSAIENPQVEVITKKTNSSIFEMRIDTILINNLEYQVRAFVTCGDKTIYGSILKFISKGSSKSAWSLEKNYFQINSWKQPFGSSCDGLGYLLFQNSDVYTYNPKNKNLSKKVSFPLKGDLNTRFTSITKDHVQYISNTIDKHLYKFQSGSWLKLSELPFDYKGIGNYDFGFAVSDNLYMLNTVYSYAYNLNTNSWKKKSSIPEDSGGAISGTSIGKSAFILTTDGNIWEYDTSMDKWTIKTKYPGNLYRTTVPFSDENVLYFGSIEKGKFWIFDTLSNTWRSAQDFPKETNSKDTISFYFCLDGKLYIGYNTMNAYSIWKYDPARDKKTY